MANEACNTTPNKWMEHMLSGNFEEAWKVSDEVLNSNIEKLNADLPRHYQVIWKGESLKGKRVLVRCYHGLGDTIQFIRYVPILKDVAKHIIVWTQPQLIPLLEKIHGIDQLLPLHDGSPEVDYDVDIEVMELPFIFRTTLETIPSTVPYLYADPIKFKANTNKFTVGLIWKAGGWDNRRDIPYKLLEPLKNIPNIQLYILQANATSAGWQEGFGTNPGEFELHNYAGVIKGLNLIISVDSMPVHLAGALAVPVWNLLHAEADWRWMRDRDDSPWYPTMRLFRQSTAGNWEDVISRVSTELKKQ